MPKFLFFGLLLLTTCQLADFLNHAHLPSANGAGDNLYQQDNLDESLGRDWLNSDDLASDNMQQPGSRAKRAAGYTMDDVVFNMSEIASQTHGVTEVDVGDSFTFIATIDLPAIAIQNKADLQIEVFVVDPNNGLTGFHICQAHMLDPRGSNIKAIQDYPYYTDEPKANYSTVIEKTTLLFEQVHTNNISTTGNSNTIQVQFQAVMVSTSDLATNTNYFITAGAEYGDNSYVWVGQTQVTSVINPSRTYDANVIITSAPSSLAKGDGALITIEAYVTEPSADFLFGIFQPLGYNDVFHIGEINRVVGNAFACSKDEYWMENYVTSPSGLSVNNASMSYPFLINREALRNVSDPVNMIVFTIPIYVMNTDDLPSGVIRELAFEMNIGSNKLWTALQEITITDYVPLPPGPPFPTLISTNMTVGSVVAGDSAVFLVQMLAPQGWSDFTVIITGDSTQGVTPVGVRVNDTGLVAYFPPDWAVSELSGNQMTVSFGAVKNVGSNYTIVVLEVSFATESTLMVNTSVTLSGTQTVGGVNIGPLVINITTNPSPASVAVAAVDFGWNSNLYTTGQAGIDLLVTVPSSAGADNFTFEAIPDLSVTNFAVRICRLRLEKIGTALPCLYHAAPEAKGLVTYSKTAPSQPFNDFGSIDINQVCPYDNGGGNDESHQFTANLVYELPLQADISAQTFKISAGIKLADSTIWVSSNDYSVQAATFATKAIEASNLTVSGGTTPFVTSYPFVTTLDRVNYGYPGSFSVNEGLFVQYIFKVQPLSRGDYSFVVTPPSAFKICKLVMTFVGDNMPCTEAPGPSFTGFENTKIVYAGGSPATQQCGQTATYSFMGLTNWGRDPIVTDLTPDGDSIQLVAFMQVCADPNLMTGTYNVTHTLTPGSGAPITGTAQIDVVSSPEFGPISQTITGTTWKSLIGPNDTIFTEVPKLLQIDVIVPKVHFGSLQIILSNHNYPTDIVDFCSIKIVKVGDNLPCIDMANSLTFTNGPNSTIIDGETVYQSIVGTTTDFCHTNVTSAIGADTITFEAAFRIRDSFTSSSVSLQLTVIPISNAAMKQDISIHFAVKVPGYGDIVTNSVTPSDVSVVSSAYPQGLPMTTGQKAWLPFVISFPPETTLKMEASLLLPSSGGVARITALDMQFDYCSGVNILCTGGYSSDTDLRRSYSNYFEQTANVTTFMQVDAVSADLGYVINAGQSLKQGVHVASDDSFLIKVLLQLSDQQLNSNGASFDIYFAVNFNDTIVVATQTVSVQRPTPGYSRQSELGDIVIVANQSNIPNAFEVNDTVHFNSIIYHSSTSMAEGYPTRIRVITPNYMSYTTLDTFSTNYTLNHSIGTNVTVSVTPNYFDFIFPNGITYSDIVQLNFSMTVDPGAKRLPGSGDETASVVLTAVCEQYVIDNYPASKGVQTQCGSHYPVPVTTVAPECYNVLSLPNECQVQASSMMNNNSKPFFSISTNTTQAWSPALRDGDGWTEYLQYDFLAVTRITKLTIGTNISSTNYRSVKKVLIQYSNVPTFFTDAQQVDLTVSNVVIFTQPIEARFLRILLVEVDPANANTSPIGINQVVWQGCFSRNYVNNVSLCLPDSTVRSDSAQQYRHFAVGNNNTIIYFCDLNPYLAGMFCFANNRAVGTGNTWIELPRYIAYIVGYSPSYGRMYFRGQQQQSGSAASLLSSRDGRRIELTDTPLPSDIQPAMNVPGLSNVSVNWISSSYTATFDGIMDKTTTTMLAQWSACCQP